MVFLSSALYIRNTNILPAHDWYSGHYWSLSVEEQFYILFPFLFRTNIKGYFIAICVLICIIPITIYVDAHQLITSGAFRLFCQLFRNMSGILVGSVFAFLFFYRIITEDFNKNHKLLFNLLFFSLAIIIHSNLLILIPSSVSPTLSAILIALLIVNNLKSNTTIFYKVLNNKILTYVGVLSYSIYIWQQIFTFNMPWKNSFVGADSKLFNLFLLVFVSIISFHLYEKWFLKLKDRFE